MIRRFEDPRKVEKLLEEAKNDYEEMVENGCDPEAIWEQYNWVEDLKERLNFAWQDDEYDWLMSKEDTYAYERFVEEREASERRWRDDDDDEDV